MAFYQHSGKRRHGLAKLGLLLAALCVIVVGAFLAVKHVYNNDLKAVSASQKAQVVTIKPGSSAKQIASQLQQAHLIRSALVFQYYVSGQHLNAKLQAGSFAISPNEDVATITGILTKGRVSTELVTILPGERIDQVRAALINYGFTPSDVDQALTNLGQYANNPVLALKPANVNSLEGLLWPDSWYKDANSLPADIIRQSLDEMGQHLTPDIQAAFAAEGLSPYQGLTLASVVMQEVSKPSDQAQAAQVFMSRLKAGTKLGSDVTALYGSIEAGGAPSLNYDSPYNTLVHTGLPPTPISTINASSLSAAAHPAGTNWLYFVAGDDGTTYFSTTFQQQQTDKQKYCHKLCGQ